jgi:hypothetical protein
VAVHIGKELRSRFEKSGMTKVAFAERIGRTPKNLYEIFERPSIDTQILRKASEVLRFNFFRLYVEDLESEMGSDLPVAADPKGTYQRSTPTVIVIQGSENDPDLIERITKATKGK